MIFYRPRFFQLEELVDPWFISQYGERTWGFLDSRMLWTIDQMRLRFGVCFINGVINGRRYTESGLRRFDTKTGAAYSLHKLGKAFDLKFSAYKAEEVRSDMKSNYKLDCYKYVSRCEDGTSWVHVDNYNMYSDRIMFFKP